MWVKIPPHIQNVNVLIFWGGYMRETSPQVDWNLLQLVMELLVCKSLMSCPVACWQIISHYLDMLFCFQGSSNFWGLTTCYLSRKEGKLVQYVVIQYMLSQRQRWFHCQILLFGLTSSILKLKTGLYNLACYNISFALLSENPNVSLPKGCSASICILSYSYI